MSKKRVVARSTMTLKDFHGGSIPSDLPLPSAPGMTVDRSSYERQSSGPWMNPSSGRGYVLDHSGFHRQGSANGIRSFEEKASYFPDTANIGRNYDEDERKPVNERPRSSGHIEEHYDDYGYDERRSYIVEEKGGFSNPSTYSEGRGPALGYQNTSHNHESTMGPSKTNARDSRPQLNAPHHNPLVPRSPEVISHGQSQYSQPQASISGGRYGYQQPPPSPPQGWRNFSNQQQAAPKIRGGSEPSTSNVWTARRESEHSRGLSTETDAPRPLSPWPPQNNIARIAEASAIEKVSSGRWQPDYSRIASPVHVDNGMSEQIRDVPFSPDSLYSGDDFHSEGYYVPRTSDVLSDMYESDRGGVYTQTDKNSSHDTAARGDPRSNGGPGYPDNNRATSIGRGGSYPDVSRIVMNERAQDSYIDPSNRRAAGSLLDRVPTIYSESDQGGFSPTGMDQRRLPDTLQNRNTGYSERGSISGHSADKAQYRDAGQTRFDKAIGQESLERSLSRNAEVGKARKGYSGTGDDIYTYRGNSFIDRQGQSQFNDDTQNVYGFESGLDARDHAITASAQKQHVLEGSIGTYPLENSRKLDSLERPERASVLEGSQRNYSSEDSRASSYVEVPGGRYNPDSGRESFSSERELKRSSSNSDSNLSFSADGSRGSVSMAIPSTDVSVDTLRVGSALIRTESGDRPRLKLLPRSKPVEQVVENASNTADEPASQEGLFKETQLGDRKHLTDPKTSEAVLTGFTLANDLKSTETFPIIETDEDASRPPERPKLNLKPRSQPVEGSAEFYSNERKSLFGDARPRELVLKEREVEDPVIVGVDKAILTSSAGGKVKGGGQINRQEGPQVEKQEKWFGSYEKQGIRQVDHHDDRPQERQANSGFLERQDSNRLERHDTGRELGQRETRRFSERLVNQADPDRHANKRDQVRHESRRESDKQNVKRDIDNKDSWRHPIEQPASVGLRNHSKENYASNGERHSAGYGGVKSGSYGVASADPKRLAALVQSKLAFGPDGLDHHANYEDFPGKRALPLRSQESYYD
ncbi:hypothetical protein O6H91_10G031700 [Diphasiastrum complanatum]|uniref:Uncharacterized protein n=5 Tax=Diphasiastrum complanatum TaxID=34168 RepID=A0ACC2AX95_DIPCM|nr:hypothetical protein O6H91_19G084900 [Diphasiastrum complanatum]KAJ7522127.1 hypothetical protein O6H91_19G084900 [Diphasiastrum complanatum]KAJ7522128.1 hypothetical protein O6H91_19G084900 [Diphasiastrum complanatum]KAJ7540808.1 hypothetical protein O6H91_10G031700 [Diphasiastrum complanatum]